MKTNIEKLYHDLVRHAARYGISVGQARLSDEVPGEFDGPTITLNRVYDATERAFYLAHSIGSIAEWSLHPDRTRGMFRELARAKKHASSDAARLARALADYEKFEIGTWQFAVWLLETLGHEAVVPAFCLFGRADLAAMRIFHSTGQAPVWRDFFPAFCQEVRQGVRSVEPFTPQPIPEFRAIRIPTQEIIQEDD